MNNQGTFCRSADANNNDGGQSSPKLLEFWNWGNDRVDINLDSYQWSVSKKNLTQKSSYFRDYFDLQDKTLNGRSNEMQIVIKEPSIDPAIFDYLMAYAKGSKVNLELLDVYRCLELFALADQFRFSRFLLPIWRQIVNKLTNDNLLDVLQISQEFGKYFQYQFISPFTKSMKFVTELIKIASHCIDLICTRIKEIFELDSFTQLPFKVVLQVLSLDAVECEEIDLFLGMVKYLCRNRYTLSKSDQTDLVACVRLEFITPEQFEASITATNLISEDAFRDAFSVRNKLPANSEWAIVNRGFVVSNVNLCGAAYKPKVVVGQVGNIPSNKQENEIGQGEFNMVKIKLVAPFNINWIEIVLSNHENHRYS